MGFLSCDYGLDLFNSILFNGRWDGRSNTGQVKYVDGFSGKDGIDLLDNKNKMGWNDNGMRLK